MDLMLPKKNLAWNVRPNYSFWNISEKIVNYNNKSVDVFGPNIILNDYKQFKIDGCNEVQTNMQQIFTGVVLLWIFIMIIKLLKEDMNHQKTLNLVENFIFKNLFKILYHINELVMFIICCFLSPMFIFMWMLLTLYKWIVYKIVEKKHETTFKGFLEGPDAVWAYEINNAKSIINMLITLDLDQSSNELDYDLPEKISNLFKTKIISQYKSTKSSKLFYNRFNKFGYYFWLWNDKFSVDEFIKYFEVPENDNLDETLLKKIVSNYSNESLPCNHTSGWEIRISPKPFKLNNTKNLQYPILFRIHHSLGDGVSLLKFFIENFSDQNLKDIELLNNLSNRKVQTSSLTILQKLLLAYKTPMHLQKLTLKSIDTNGLHSKELSGNKIVSFLSESTHNNSFDRKKSFLNIIKNKKRNLLNETKFCEIFLAIISSSLKKMFMYKKMEIPNELTLVMPMRIEALSSQTNLENRFSVALQEIPINKQNINNDNNIEENIGNIKEYTRINQLNFTYQINYWIMSFLSSLLPDILLRPILKSKHSTMAMSNLPGPENVLTILNHKINLFTFWLPNRDTTGVGISLFSYNNRLHFGIIADKNLISEENDLNFILRNFEKEISLMNKN